MAKKIVKNKLFDNEFPNKKPLAENALKEDKLIVRIDPDLKEKFTEYVKSKGATVSDYVRQMIVEEINKTKYEESVIYENKFETKLEELTKRVDGLNESLFKFIEKSNPEKK